MHELKNSYLCGNDVVGRMGHNELYTANLLFELKYFIFVFSTH